jgi:hypothetical protein
MSALKYKCHEDFITLNRHGFRFNASTHATGLFMHGAAEERTSRDTDAVGARVPPRRFRACKRSTSFNT